MKELTLSEIWIYPVKSLGGISLQSSKVRNKGLLYDRRYMLVDVTGKFITQRVHSQLALFKLTLTATEIVITHRDDQINLAIEGSYLEPPLQVTIWDDTVTAYEVNKEHSNWFSEKLGMNCRLVFFPEPNPRPVDPRYAVNAEHVNLADAYPFLVIGQRSLDNLNLKLDKPVPMNRFRPNFVFTGGDAFEEDTWRNFSVGDNRFVGVKQCSRCVLITIDQETAETGKEPLRTLAKYRTKNNKIYVGRNLVTLDEGEIKVGDRIVVDSYQ